MSRASLRQITIHKSLTRPILLMGVEREFMILNATLIAALVFGFGFTKIAMISAVFLASFGHWSLTWIGKRDSFMSRIYLRHIRYQSYYQARGSRLSQSPIVRPSIT